MSEPQEDFNAFNSWDCFGASLMLGMTPALLNYVFNHHEIVSTVFLAAMGVAVAVAVLLVALVTRRRLIGYVVNMVGWVLTLVYIGIAAYCWLYLPGPMSAPPAETPEQSETVR
ncbi:MAG: hypothetical protein ACI4PZ_03490 [Akkermansia sp.]